MKKLTVFFATLLLGLFIVASNAKAADLSMLPSDLQDLIQELLDTRFPPELKGITLDPAEPVAGAPTKVAVEIYNDSSASSDTTTGVTFYYMVNFDGVWQAIELESGDSKKWTGEMPGFAKDDEIVYSVRAVDSSTNVFTTVPCKADEVEGFGPFQPEYLKDCAKTTPDLSSCEDSKPRGCFFKGSGDDDPIDDEDSISPVDGDFSEIRVGFGTENNEEVMYYDIAVQGKIYKGTANPVDLRAYVGLAINPDKVGKAKDLDSLLASSGGAALVYAPLADLAGGMVKSCSFTYMKGGSAVQDDKAVKCQSKDGTNHLIFKIKRKDAVNVVGANPSNTLNFFAVTASITNISPVEGKKFDNTHFTSAKFDFDGEYYFQVK